MHRPYKVTRNGKRKLLRMHRTRKEREQGLIVYLLDQRLIDGDRRENIISRFDFGQTRTGKKMKISLTRNSNFEERNARPRIWKPPSLPFIAPPPSFHNPFTNPQ